MSGQVKYGLIVGGIGLVINACASAFVGLCGPFVMLLVGALAGFLTAREARLPSKSEASRTGATAGAIAGALMVIGQLIGGFIALLFVQMSGATPLLGSPPNAVDGVGMNAFYYLSGFGASLCFGLVGMALSAGASAGCAYLATNEQPQVNSTAF